MRCVPLAYLRYRQPQILTQCRSGEVCAEQTTALQLGNDEAHEALIRAGDMGGEKHEAITGGRGEPSLERIGHFVRAADDRVMHAPASADLDEIANRWIFLSRSAQHAVADALQARHFLQFLRGEWLVHALPGEVKVEGLRHHI